MILIYGLGLLGYTTAACTASQGCNVAMMIDEIQPPIPDEPGLRPLLNRGLATGCLDVWRRSGFTPQKADIAWVTFDTPVDALGNADVDWLRRQCHHICDSMPSGCVILVSSQVPIGFTRQLQASYPQLHVIVSPENLRRGHAIEDFKSQRLVLGVTALAKRAELDRLYHWRDKLPKAFIVTAETAEMTKHARNAFLALSIAFAQEIEIQCIEHDIDYRHVAEVLKEDRRIGAHAYINGGHADGRHLLRDVRYLIEATGSERWLLQDILRSPAWAS